MRIPIAFLFVRRMRLGILIPAWLLLCAAAPGQPIRFSIGTVAPAELSAAQVESIPNTTSSRLEQARSLAENKNWEEAVDILRELAASESSGVVEVGNGLFVNLRTFCQVQLARLPAAALAIYRQRVDAPAEAWYRQGLAQRDERLLRRVVDELYCSSWGDEALLMLGEMALERAEYEAARRWWEQISPDLRDPAGRPLWLALQDIDLNAHWPEVERRWNERSHPVAWLTYPDTNLDLADVRARLILTSIRAGELKRAALELEVFRRLHPNAVGRLGGREGLYVTMLERLLATARQLPAEPLDANWPTFAGAPSRSPAVPRLGPITGPAWAAPVSLTPPPVTVASVRLTIGGQWIAGDSERDRSQTPVREAERPLTCFPISVQDLVLYCHAAQIFAVDLQTGKPAVTRGGALYQDESLAEPGTLNRTALGGRWNLPGRGTYGVPRYTLSVAEGIVYGRVGPRATARLEPGGQSSRDRLVGLDLGRDGQLVFARAGDADWAFDGVPVGDDQRLFVAMRHSDVTPRAYVACFDARSGNQVWRTPIGTADTPVNGAGDEITHNLLTLVGDRIYINTNLGLVAALDATNGEICWIRRYERQTSDPFVPGQSRPPHFDRDPSPCLYYNGLVLVAPADTPNIFALDAVTGQMVWSTPQLPDALQLLGVVRQNLIVSGYRLAAVDIGTGKLKFVWPESEHAGIRGIGRGLVAGDEVFWPTRREIYVIHGVTGAQSRPPIRLGTISDCGANLAAAQGRLIVAGYDKLMVFGPALPVPPNHQRTRTKNNEPIASSE